MTSPDPQIGKRLGGRFVLERSLGSGGAGMVYEALQEDLGRKVAVKLLLPELAAEPEVLARFRREARAAAALGHPHIAHVLDFAEPRAGEPAFIVFELAQGESLHALLSREDVLSPTRAVTLCCQILAGLEAAHRAGIVHRDLKPANVFIADLPGVGENAKILDFGIAQVREGEAFRRLTATGVVIGTPRYMSPEQISARTVDARSDLWSVGILLYRMLTGIFPFEGKTGELLGAIRSQPTPPMPKEARVPPAIEEVVARALRKDPDERWESASTMAAALRAALSGIGAPSTTLRPPKRAKIDTSDPTETAPQGPNAPENAHGRQPHDTLEDVARGVPRTQPMARIAATRAAGKASLRKDAAAPEPDSIELPVPKRAGSSRAFIAIAGACALAVAAAVYLWIAPHTPEPPPVVPPTTTAVPTPITPTPTEPTHVEPVEPTPVEPPVALAPARGTLDSFIHRAALFLGPEGAYAPVEVLAVGLDQTTGILDFEAVAGTALELDLRGADGQCVHYELDPDRSERSAPRGACREPIPPPMPEPLAVIEAGRASCHAFASASGPVRLAIRRVAGVTEIEVETADGAHGFVATSDTWGAIEVLAARCQGEPARVHRRGAGEDGVINPWGN